MTELKLSEIKGLLPNKTVATEPYECDYDLAFAKGKNEIIDELSTKNLLDFVEAVVCDECGGKGLSHRSLTDLCEFCNGTGAVIRVKEGE